MTVDVVYVIIDAAAALRGSLERRRHVKDTHLLVVTGSSSQVYQLTLTNARQEVAGMLAVRQTGIHRVYRRWTLWYRLHCTLFRFVLKSSDRPNCF